jgi:amino acid adenylation domain-containing protein
MEREVIQGFRLSPQQHHLWLLQAAGADAPYCVQCSLLIEGRLDTRALEGALTAVVARYEVLRTTFQKFPEMNAPLQVIADAGSPTFVRHDLSGAAPDERAAQVEAILAAERSAAVGPQTGAPLRAALLTLGADEHLLTVTLPALCADLISCRAVLSELMRAYSSAGREQVEEPIQYADVAEVLNDLLESDETRAGREYWREQDVAAALDAGLPFEQSRAPERGFSPRAVELSLPAQTLERINESAEGADEYSGSFFLTCWQALLLRLVGEAGATMGVLYDGRAHADLAHVVGLFAKCVPVRCAFANDTPFAEAWRRTREVAAEVEQWQDYFAWETFTDDAARPPELLFSPFAFEWIERPAPPDAGALKCSAADHYALTERFKVKLTCTREGDSVRAALVYDAALYEADDIRRLAEEFETLVASALQTPRAEVQALEIVGARERQQLLVELNRTEREYPAACCVHELFEEQAARAPDAIALVYGERLLSYGELNARAEQLAERLRGLGVGPEVKVAVYLRRTPEALVALLAVLKAGGAYVPLDPAFPPARLRLMLPDCDPAVLLTQTSLAADLPASAGPRVCLDDEQETIAAERSNNPRRRAGAGNAAYVMYTSGSTGRPKGVVVEHRQLVNYVYGVCESLRLRENTSYATVSTLAADLGHTTMFAALCTGATLHIISDEMVADAPALADYFQRHQIDCLKIVPSHLAALVASVEPGLLLPRRQLILGGEVASPELLEKLRQAKSDCEVLNHYGPTETTVGVLTHDAGASGTDTLPGALPLGRPLANTRVYLLDAQLNLVPTGVAGRLYVAGAGLARGYLNDVTATAERFIPDPFSGVAGGRLYATGDLVRRLPSGDIEFMGRADDQVKVRGFRVELGEVESVLRRHASVRDAVVLARRDQTGATALVAYVVPQEKAAPSGPDALDIGGDAGRGETVAAPTGQGGFASIVAADERATDAGLFVEAARHGRKAAANSNGNGQTEASDTHAALPEPPPLSADLLRAYLRAELPEYQVPAAFFLLEELPLAPNGKLDRQALVALEQAQLNLDTEHLAPRTPVEEVIANIWSSLLRVEHVGAHDNFFDLGGHSLLAMQLASRLRSSFKVETPLPVLFEAPTVASLAAYVEGAMRNTHGVEAPALVPVARDTDPPLSFAQQRLWFLDQLNPGLSNYNMATALRLSGALDVAALRRSLAEVVRRHEALRTTLPSTEGRPVQRIAPEAELELPLEDLSRLPEAEREAEARRLAREEAATPFDLAAGPLFRARLLRLGDEEHVALFTMHHIISDGWSMAILVREVAALYEAGVTGRASPLAALPIQHADYSAWQRDWLRGEVLERHLDYWRAQLADAPAATELPADRPRPPVMSFRGAWEDVALPAELSGALAALSRREGATLFMTLLTAFQVLLHHYSAQTDIVIGSPIAGRNRTEIEGLIGFFVNTLLLRTKLAGNPTFRELLRQVRETALEAYAHQDVPFEKIVEELQPERDLSRQPLFQVVFALGNVPRPNVELSGLTINPFVDDDAQPAADGDEKRTAKFDLTLSLRETPEGLRGSVEYNTDLFDAATIRRLLDSWQSLLAGVVADPSARISELPVLTAEERRRLTHDLNQTATDYPKHATIQSLFEARAAETPQAVAVVFGDEHITYGQLNERANQLAHYLRQEGVGPESPVGILTERSVEMVVALLGITKAGGAYVPLDPASPPERLAFMLADAGVRLLLAQKHLGVVLPADISAQVFYLDARWSALERLSTENPVATAGPDNLAYVIYTSGSTGTPKGVSVPHRAVVRLVRDTDYADFGPDEVFLQLAPLSFDASTFEIWGSLLNGARLVVMPPQQPSLDELGEALRERGVTTLWLTAGLFHVMVDHQLDDLRGLRQLLAGGDVLSVAHVERFLLEASSACLINGYGPTESTTFACCHRMRGARAEDFSHNSVPIGRPIANTRVHILDAYGGPVAVGVVGELYIGGDGLARNYLNRPALTAERFVPDPFSAEPGGRLYKTGDLVRYLPDGRIEFLGRVDDQVKVRGFRIEIGEVEAALSQHPAVRETVVVARADVAGDKRLVAYVVVEQEQGATVNDLRSHLRQRLPAYMLPSAFVVLEKLPLTESGKIDRQALPAPLEDRAELDANFVAPRDTVELLLAQIWEDVLDVPRVGVCSNFFEVGGNSILGVILIARIDRVFGIQLPLAALFEGATIEHLGIMLRQEKSSLPYSSLVAIQPHGTQPPFFCVHPAGGTVNCYADLARSLGLGQPFYGLQSRGLDVDEEMGTGIEEMAAHYVETIRSVQPEGPYRLGGWSLGGGIAYEMARQLKEQGEEVSLLALLDAALPDPSWAAGQVVSVDDAEMLHLILNEMLGDTVWRSLDHLRTLDLDEQLQFVMELARKANKMVPDYQLPQARRLFNLFKQNLSALRAYEPRHYPGRILLFRPADELPEGATNLARGWDKLAEGGVEIHVVPGTHRSMITEPNVAALAERLGGYLDEPEAGGAAQVVLRLMDA